MIRSFRGKMPRIAESACVSESACVIGDVEIGEDSSIWPGVIVRADYGGGELGCGMKIGSNTHIEDNAVVHFAKSIGNNVLIGHGAVVEATRIGDNVLIGDNATILTSAEIGNFCIIGAGAMVMEGMKIPDRSFVVGTPAVIKKELSAEQMKRVKEDPFFIADLAKEHQTEGF
jgi:carbonic anhydrase/acetyltransferase-like protein (isoleucine patch superfamily)